VPNRIANIVVLAEDREQQNLVRRYLERCGHNLLQCRFSSLSGRGGSGEKYVRDNYTKEVRACRSSWGRRTSALLVVIVDADTESAQHRANQLARALRDANEQPRGSQEPIAVLIPKRHVETWIRALLGGNVDEETDYTKAPYSVPTSQDISAAALELHAWTRAGAGPGARSPPSLTASIPEWRRIPS
jgi:hypothetical protein